MQTRVVPLPLAPDVFLENLQTWLDKQNADRVKAAIAKADANSIAAPSTWTATSWQYTLHSHQTEKPGATVWAMQWDLDREGNPIEPGGEYKALVLTFYPHRETLQIVCDERYGIKLDDFVTAVKSDLSHGSAPKAEVPKSFLFKGSAAEFQDKAVKQYGGGKVYPSLENDYAVVVGRRPRKTARVLGSGSWNDTTKVEPIPKYCTITPQALYREQGERCKLVVVGCTQHAHLVDQLFAQMHAAGWLEEEEPPSAVEPAAGGEKAVGADKPGKRGRKLLPPETIYEIARNYEKVRAYVTQEKFVEQYDISPTTLKRYLKQYREAIRKGEIES